VRHNTDAGGSDQYKKDLWQCFHLNASLNISLRFRL
jgi:hypothetical protein